MSEDARALVLDTDGGLREVILPADSHLQAMYTAIGCQFVDVVAIAPDLDMWVDDNGYGVEPVNVAATQLKDLLVGHTQMYYGAALFTGGIDEDGETLGLSEERAQWVREGLDVIHLMSA